MTAKGWAIHGVNQYASNPKVISVAGSPAGFGDHFMAADLNGDGAPDYLFRSETTLYAYDHDGGSLWSVAIALEEEVNGSSFGVADVDGDGSVEVVALNASDEVLILTGSSGSEEDRFAVAVGTDQRAVYLQIVNLRGLGLRDLIVQTNDVMKESEKDGQPDGYRFYINRSLYAYRLDTYAQLWTVAQDKAGTDGDSWYEGYWGQAHGGFLAVDIDGDGLDEVVGGNIVDDDGTAASVGYSKAWVNSSTVFVDHLDGVSVGDFRPDLAGLEWAVTEEGHLTDRWNTVLLTGSSELWKAETTLDFGTTYDPEPQNCAIGNFSSSGIEVWNRSRFGRYDTHSLGQGQHPWIFDISGSQIGHYAQTDMLPDLFNLTASSDNDDAYGIEMIWTIDWDGGNKEYLAGQSRGVSPGGNVGVFDAITGAPVWTTVNITPQINAKSIFVADVAGDSREEIVVFDLADNTLKIFHNEDAFTDTHPNKWDDPLYRRLKQNWSYYSPGSYTARSTVQLSVKVFLEGPYDTGADNMANTLQTSGYLPLTSPYVEDPRVVASLPSGTVDWALLELRTSASGPAVYTQSVLLSQNGQIMDENGNTAINVFVEPQNSYYIVIKHRNHLAVMSASANPVVTEGDTFTIDYNFSTAESQYYGGDAAFLESGVYGMVAGDGNSSGIVTFADKDPVNLGIDQHGYYAADINLTGIVTYADKDPINRNIDRSSKVPN